MLRVSISPNDNEMRQIDTKKVFIFAHRIMNRLSESPKMVQDAFEGAK